MTEMIEWLRAQLDTDEKAARKAAAFPYDHPADAPWERARLHVERGVAFTSDAHIALHGPERVLRQVQAHRAILTAYDDALSRKQYYDRDGEEEWFRGHSAGYVEALEGAIRALVSIYSDRDGFNPEWSA